MFLLLLDVVLLKNPVGHTSHLGCATVEPDAVVYWPAGHLVWGAHASVPVLLFDVKALKNPVRHGSHLGCAVAVPAVRVYFRAGHFVWAMHRIFRQPVVTEQHTFQSEI